MGLFSKKEDSNADVVTLGRTRAEKKPCFHTHGRLPWGERSAGCNSARFVAMKFGF